MRTKLHNFARLQLFFLAKQHIKNVFRLQVLAEYSLALRNRCAFIEIGL